MYNRDLLEDAIRASGLRKHFIAKHLEMAYPTMLHKIHGETEWKISEVQKLSDLIGISPDQRNTIFFG